MTGLDWLVAPWLWLGAFCLITGAVGLLRFPDVYSRLHAAGVADTLGAGAIMAGLMIVTTLGDHGWLTALWRGEGWHGAEHGVITTFKLMSVLFFMWVTSTTACHALAKAAWLAEVEPQLGSEGDR